MTSETKTMFHSEDMGVFNRPLAVSIKYDGLNRPTQHLLYLGCEGNFSKIWSVHRQHEIQYIKQLMYL